MNAQPSRDRVRPAEAGFTLVEVMVVIVILGILATLVARNVVGASDEARETLARTNAKMIYDAVSSYRAKHGKMPEALATLAEKDDKGRSEIEELPQDPWGNDYMLVEGNTPREFDVVSPGPDGSQGTEDDISSKVKKEN
jgi:general secretion pathway protein G